MEDELKQGGGRKGDEKIVAALLMRGLRCACRPDEKVTRNLAGCILLGCPQGEPERGHSAGLRYGEAAPAPSDAGDGDPGPEAVGDVGSGPEAVGDAGPGPEAVADAGPGPVVVGEAGCGPVVVEEEVCLEVRQ